MTAEYFLTLGLLATLVASAAGTLLSARLLHAVIIGGALSMGLAAEYVFLGAPDVALTEAAVGGGISSVLMLTAIFYVGEDKAASKARYAWPLTACSALLGASCAGFLTLPSVGSTLSAPALGVAAEYMANLPGDVGVPNAVTAILASYRGADTFCETGVIFAAGISVYAIMTAPARQGDARGV